MSPPSIGAPRAPKRSLARYVHGYHPVGSGVDHLAKISSSPSAMSSRLAAHTDQASQVAARGLIPADSSTLAPCPFSHNPTLQHYRLPTVTPTATKSSGLRISKNSVMPNFGEKPFLALQ